MDKGPKPMTRREKEEQFFAEEEQRKRKQLREKLDKEREVQKKELKQKTHFMKCPKCGHDLVEKGYADILIDECASCKGIWLDAGELELLLGGRKSKGFLSKFFDGLGADED